MISKRGLGWFRCLWRLPHRDNTKGAIDSPKLSGLSSLKMGPNSRFLKKPAEVHSSQS